MATTPMTPTHETLLDEDIKLEEKIYLFRAAHHLTRSKFCKTYQINFYSLSGIEAGTDCRVLLSTLIKIAGALGCTLAELVTASPLKIKDLK